MTAMMIMMMMPMINEPGSLCGDLGHLFFHVLRLLLLLEQFKEVFINDADHDHYNDGVGEDNDGEEPHLPPPAPPARVQQGEGEIRLQTLIHISRFHISIYSHIQIPISIITCTGTDTYLQTSRRSKTSTNQWGKQGCRGRSALSASSSSQRGGRLSRRVRRIRKKVKRGRRKMERRRRQLRWEFFWRWFSP